MDDEDKKFADKVVLGAAKGEGKTRVAFGNLVYFSEGEEDMKDSFGLGVQELVKVMEDFHSNPKYDTYSEQMMYLIDEGKLSLSAVLFFAGRGVKMMNEETMSNMPDFLKKMLGL